MEKIVLEFRDGRRGPISRLMSGKIVFPDRNFAPINGAKYEGSVVRELDRVAFFRGEIVVDSVSLWEAEGYRMYRICEKSGSAVVRNEDVRYEGPVVEKKELYYGRIRTVEIPTDLHGNGVERVRWVLKEEPAPPVPTPEAVLEKLLPMEVERNGDKVSVSFADGSAIRFFGSGYPREVECPEHSPSEWFRHPDEICGRRLAVAVRMGRKDHPWAIRWNKPDGWPGAGLQPDHPSGRWVVNSRDLPASDPPEAERCRQEVSGGVEDFQREVVEVRKDGICPDCGGNTYVILRETGLILKEVGNRDSPEFDDIFRLVQGSRKNWQCLHCQRIGGGQVTGKIRRVVRLPIDQPEATGWIEQGVELGVEGSPQKSKYSPFCPGRAKGEIKLLGWGIAPQEWWGLITNEAPEEVKILLNWR